MHYAVDMRLELDVSHFLDWEPHVDPKRNYPASLRPLQCPQDARPPHSSSYIDAHGLQSVSNKLRCPLLVVDQLWVLVKGSSRSDYLRLDALRLREEIHMGSPETAFIKKLLSVAVGS
jgi:hypothetical protein